MPCGYHDKILRVDLTTGKVEVEQPGEHFFRTYFGGWGLIAHYLLQELEPGTDPLGPDNLLIFATGVVTGAPVGGSGRSAVGARSPLTGGFGEGDVGGFWGVELKRAGWDAIIITGQAEKPVCLWVKDDQVEIRDGAHLWGKQTAEVEEILKDELGDKRIRVTQCGVAGENLVRYACVINDVNRAAGRTGLGAVMGSKNLKAVVVRGTGRVDLANRDQVRQVADWLRDNFKETWALGLHENGTDNGLLYLSQAGGLPTRNFQQGSFEEANSLTGQTMTDTILVGRDTCFACPVTCKRKVKVTGRYEVDPVYGGPEYETAAALGSCCGIDDLEAVAYGNQLCNAYGLDTISTGVTIAWAMECFERGLLTEEDTGGLELRFGNVQAMTNLIEQIAHRQGFGDLLAEGSLRAAKRIGRETERYAMQVKGQEFPMHEPRIKFAHDLGYATSPTGADHMHNIHDGGYASEGGIQGVRSLGILEPMPFDYLGPEKVRLAKYHIDWQVFWNCLGLCMFMPYSREQMRDVVQGVTGWNSSIFELMKAGERALALARAFNYREGFTAQDDVAHWRFSTPFESGPKQGTKVPAEDIAQALDLYYEMRGWDKETGAPTTGKLHELGIGWVAELLYRD
ncbi:MAG: aldehyde ferredoxin oxidoreductase family protein [Anaerolineae bacterium]